MLFTQASEGRLAWTQGAQLAEFGAQEGGQEESDSDFEIVEP